MPLPSQNHEDRKLAAEGRRNFSKKRLVFADPDIYGRNEFKFDWLLLLLGVGFFVVLGIYLVSK